MNKTILIALLEQVKSLIIADGESSFKELKPRVKREIFKLMDAQIDFVGGGDKEDSWLQAVLGEIVNDSNLYDVIIHFSSTHHCFDEDEFMSNLTKFYVDVDAHNDNTVEAIDALISRLASPSKLINYTPHDITVYADDKQTVVQTIPSERDADGKPVFIRVNQEYTKSGEVNGIPVVKSSFGSVSGLPESQPDTILLVSLMVAQALPYRKDLLVPDTNVGAVRDESGRIIGTTRLMRV